MHLSLIHIGAIALSATTSLVPYVRRAGGVYAVLCTTKVDVNVGADGFHSHAGSETFK